MKNGMRICAALLALVLILICGGCLAATGLAEASETGPAAQLPERSTAAVFTDVPSGSWYADAVAWCLENGLMSGTSSTTFSPDGIMTRGMLATVLYQAAGSPSLIEPPYYLDVPIDSWYAEGVAWTSLHGIVSGYGNDYFGPEDPVTREQIAAILWRYDGSTPAQSTAEFTDRDTISDYAVPAVDWAWENGILSGLPDGSVSPGSSATRAQVAVMLFRFLSGDGSDGEHSMSPNGVLTTNSGEEIALSGLSYRTTDADAPTVYFLSDITPEALVSAYEALEWTPSGEVAVKLSTGEPGSNYLRPELIADLVHLVDGTIVECNTAYGGSRASTAMHYQLAEDHGFTAIADVQIQDENGSMTLPVESGTVLSENYVGAAFDEYDSYLVLSHFKGHSMRDDLLAAFMMSSILLNPQLMIYSAALGRPALIIRVTSCFLCGVIAGLAVRLFYRDKPFFQFNGLNGPSNRNTDPNPFLRFLKNLGRNIRATAPWFFLGVILSALFQRYVPAQSFAALFGEENEGFGVLMAATIGVPLYACGGGTIPLLQQWLWSGMSLGSAASFMITGPATKITNLGALKIVLGPGHFLLYILFIIMFSLLTGWVINLF